MDHDLINLVHAFGLPAGRIVIVSRFLLWARHAPAGDRAEATAALCRAYLYSQMSAPDRAEAETAMTAMLDDPSPLVRRALAETLAHSTRTPVHIVVALAGDQADVAEIVLARSPVLADCDLVDCAALGDERVQCAIAARRRLSSPVSAALAEIGTLPALVFLARNETASLASFSAARMIERFGSDGPLREALLARPDLPAAVAQSIASIVAADLERFVVGCGWLSPERSSRVAREARERATVTLSKRGASAEAGALVEHLRVSGQLTAALILRALLSEALPFVEAAMAALAGMPEPRVRAILRDRSGGAFRPLFGRAGLPTALLPAFEAALAALRHGGGDERVGAGLSRPTVRRAIEACRGLPPAEAGRVSALLRRFEAEAALDEAREAAGAIADRAAFDLVRAEAPEMLSEILLPPPERLAA